jgi:L-cysteine/cystine lyase
VNAVASELTPQARRELLAELLLDRHRQLFPTLQRKVYLNYGAQGPLPAPALDAIRRFYEELNEAAPMSLDGTLSTLDELHRTRAALAAELGAGEPERIALVDNTSTGCDIVLWGLAWRRGDHLLLGDHEYPGVAAAVREVARRHELAVDLLPTDVEPGRLLDELDRRLKPETRLVVLSHVLWDTGRLLPLEEILALCRERGRGRIRVLVDGAQSVGVLPLDLAALGADYYAFPGHKWCCGPEGTGGLYVDPQAFDDLSPTFLGPHSLTYEAGKGFGGLQPDARRFETSTSPVALYAGLRAALALHGSWGDRQARWRRVRKLSHLLWQRLAELEPALLERLQAAPPEAGLVFLRLRGREENQDRLVRFLETKEILARTMPHTNSLRLSVHYLTQEKDLESLIVNLQRFPPHEFQGTI